MRSLIAGPCRFRTLAISNYSLSTPIRPSRFFPDAAIFINPEGYPLEFLSLDRSFYGPLKLYVLL